MSVGHVTQGSVFDDLHLGSEEAAHLRTRAALMHQIVAYIEEHELTQRQASKVLRVSQPRISDLRRGKIQLFTVDTLIKMLNRIGQHIELKVNGMTVAIA